MKRSIKQKAKEVKLKDRMQLKRSMDSGESQVLDSRDKRSKTLDEILQGPDPLSLLEMGHKLGAGVYGEARVIVDSNNNVMAISKIVQCRNELLGSIEDSPFRAEHIEPRVTRFLWTHIVETGISPHIMAPMGPCKIIDNKMVSFMECAPYSDLKTYLEGLSKAQFNAQFLPTLFQVCYTLGALFEKWPNFRHNDLKDDNIFVHRSETMGHISYTIYGQEYHVPAVGATVVLGDFDFVSIAGYMFDNYKTLEQEWDTPSYSIHSKCDQSSDLYSLMTWLRHHFHHKMDKDMQERVQQVFGPFQNINCFRMMPGTSSLTVKQLFKKTGLFASFEAQVHEPSVTQQRYVSPAKQAGQAIIVPELPVLHEKRHCPIFIGRTYAIFNPVDRLASAKYFAQCPVAPDAMDGEAFADFDETECERIVSLLDEPYHADLNKHKETHKFPPAKREECMTKVYELASSFINNYFVAKRWWYAAFTCAFMDTIKTMGICHVSQRAWVVQSWCEYWQRAGEVRYSDMNMLHFAMQWRWIHP